MLHEHMFAWSGQPRNQALYDAARSLRRDRGCSFKHIAKELGISVATAHMWTRDIALTPDQRHRLDLRHSEAVKARAATWRRICRDRRRAYQLEGRQRALESDPLHMAGCMLYWAEGAKSRNTLKLANSDPDLVAFFCQFLRESLGVENDEIRLNLNVYLGNGLTITQIEDHWLAALDLQRSCLRKHTIDALPTSSSGAKRNKLPYGVATVRVNNTQLVQHVYGAIQEYAGFDNPAWLD